MLEGLEARTLLAASLDVPSATLNVFGTSGDDTIEIEKLTDHFVTINGERRQYSSGKIKHIFIQARGGNDRIVIGNSITAEVVIRGGDGIDTADYSERSDNLVLTIGKHRNGRADDQNNIIDDDVEIVIGGSGNDTITGSDRDNTLIGSGGNDKLIGEGGKDLLDGGTGDDTFVAGGGDDEFKGGTGTDTADYSNESKGIYVKLDDLANDGMTSAGEKDNVHSDIEVVIGTDKADEIDVSIGGDHTVKSAGGNDTVWGGFGADFVEGGQGDDLISDPGGANLLFGNLGNDRIRGGVDGDYIEGGPDAQTLLAGGKWSALAAAAPQPVTDNDNISGGDGDDAIVAGFGNDIVKGFSGADKINGGAGDDQITGEDGNDTLNGGDGNDILNAGTEDDEIDGGTGIDSIDAGDGNDKVTDDGSPDPNTLPAVAYGGEGNDTMTGTGPDQVIFIGGGGDDSIDGGDGDDILDGADGADTIFGMKGNDTIAGGYGMDDMHGREGNDIFINNDGEADSMHGGDDIDMLQVEESDLDTFVFTEAFFDGTGHPEPPTREGGEGDGGVIQRVMPIFAGGGSADGLTASRAQQVGSELQVFGDFSSTGSPLSDNISITQVGGTIFVEQNGATPVPFTGITQIYVDTGSGADNIALQLFSGANAVQVPATILAGNGNDTVVGGAANDRISGGNDNDNIAAGAGNDYVRGDAGNDVIDGSSGDDVLNGGNNDLGEADGADVIIGGAGAGDYADYSGRTINLVLTLDGVANDNGDNIAGSIENLMGGKGNDLLIGNSGANFLSGAGGQDTMKGGGGNDQIVASVTTDFGLTDSVFGNAGYDYLFIEDKIRDNFNAVSGQDFWRTELDGSGVPIDVLVADQA